MLKIIKAERIITNIKLLYIQQQVEAVTCAGLA